MKFGILALQGAFGLHETRLHELGIEACLIRQKKELSSIDALIIPGGESTSLIYLAKYQGMWDELKEFKKPCFGICAGAVLMAKEVLSPKQESLGLINVIAFRNAYGRQVNSFVDILTPTDLWKYQSKIKGVFIRAPKINASESVKVLLKHGNDPVLVEQGYFMAATFHPELTCDNDVHLYFVNKVKEFYG